MRALAFVTALTAALTYPTPAPAQTAADAEAEASTAAAAQVDSPRLQLATGATLQAVLETKLDAQQIKVDDAVTARSTHAVDVQASEALKSLPRGSKLLGHITQVQVAAEGQASSDSRVGVIFDRVVLPDGRELAAALEIQALAAAEAAGDTSVPAPSLRTSGRARAGGGLVGAASGTLGAATDVVTGTAGALGAQTGAALDGATQLDTSLSTSTTGVVGLRGLSLETSASSSTIVSTRGPVVLRSGTRLLLRAHASAN